MLDKNYIREAIAFRREQQLRNTDRPGAIWYQEMKYRQFSFTDAGTFLFMFAARQYRQLVRKEGQS